MCLTRMKSLVNSQKQVWGDMTIHTYLSPSSSSPAGGLKALAKDLLQDIGGSIPGMDEAKSFIQVMAYAYHCIEKKLPPFSSSSSTSSILLPPPPFPLFPQAG